MKKKRVIKWIGNVLTIISLILIIIEISKMQIDFQTLLSFSSMPFFLVALGFQIAIVLVSFYPWFILVKEYTGKTLCKKEVAYIFLNANIFKYLPGNIFHYVGRNKLAVREELNHIDVFAATFTDAAIGFCTGFLFSLPFLRIQIVEKIDISIDYIFILIPVILVILFLTLKILSKNNNFKKKYTNFIVKYKNYIGRKGIILCLKPFAYYVVQNLLTVFIVMLTARGINSSIESTRLFLLGGGYIFSSLIGVITPGAPGGLGIRESVMLLIAGDTINKNDLILLIVVLRLIGVLGDFFAFFIACFMKPKKEDEV